MTAQGRREDDSPIVEDRKTERTPLPKLQLLIVSLIQFAEPVTATVIYPFVNQLVRETGITGGDEAKTGYYAGIVESTFFFSETLTVFAWGWLSDLLGRKPVLLLGPLGLSFAMLGFGLSTTFWPLVFFRAFQGLFNGNIGISKSVLAEITDSTNIGDAYSLAPLMWSAGLTIGPTLGGVLSSPASRWPDTFGRIPLFHHHPYFLPCAAAAFIAFASFFISSIALKETLPASQRAKLSSLWRRDRQKQKAARDDTTPLLTDATSDHYATVAAVESGVPIPVKEEERPPLSQLFVPSFVITLANFGLLAFVDMSMSALIPLVYSTPIEYGGLGMDPLQIGTIMGTFSILNGVFSGLFLGSLIRRYGTLNLYQTGIFSFFVVIGGFPVGNALARRAGGIDAFVLMAVVIQFVAIGAMYPCYTSLMLMVIQNTPSKLLLGSANGAAQMVTSGSRALAPAIASSLFSLSIQRNLLGGHAVYYIFVVLTAIVIRASRYLPSPPLEQATASQ
ncbi:hypothetical protein EST38_g340 [Candolleomyces aberdarensis]|uniref:Major facilitator superfamily (MFS) profile domain-containing protein n=1 Tax=Candolleomyces aberdarensis TaxID=2316362 RepID=A0A4Q2E287_9AGAR|nr:hypothetical protein EST38_g340 [Candolleomyces aberdarensis]